MLQYNYFLLEFTSFYCCCRPYVPKTIQIEASHSYHHLMWFCLIKFDLLQTVFYSLRLFVDSFVANNSWAKRHINGHEMQTTDNPKRILNFQLWTSRAYELIFGLKCWQWATDVIVRRNCFFCWISQTVDLVFPLIFMFQSIELLAKKKHISNNSFARSSIFRLVLSTTVYHWFFPFHGVKNWNAISLIDVNVHYQFQFPLEFHGYLKCMPNCWNRCAFHTSLCRIDWAWKYPNMLPSKLCDYRREKKTREKKRQMWNGLTC